MESLKYLTCLLTLMHILSLELKNIRSYKQEEIFFPQGLVLLSGDIGSGKSTLLLAIEFALFGLQRGQLSGSDLLRHGAQEGKVKLTCDIAGEEITIVRSLKKTATSVSQAAGSLIINGSKQDMTAVELKAKVLELLAYPESLLTQKSLVFRYTIYTPQEHMKNILFEKADERLDTFRKLFGIDKYKRIRENAAFLARELRVTIERLRGQADDLPEREKELADSQEEKLKGAGQLLDLEKKTQEAKKESEELQKQLALVEKEAQERKEQQKEHLRIKEQQIQQQRQLERLSREQKGIEDELAKLPDKEPETRELKERIVFLENEIKELQEHITQNSRNEAKIQSLVEQLEKTVRSVEELDDCPTCKQKVPHTHKKELQQSTQEKILRIKERQAQIQQKQEDLESRLKKKQEQQQLLRKETEELLREKSRYSFREQYQKQLENKRLEQEETKKIFAKLQEKEQELIEQLTLPFDEKKLDVQRQEARVAQGILQQAIMMQSKAEERINGLEARIEALNKQIQNKKSAVNKARNLEARREWLTKEFTSLMSSIERQVLMALYHQFNDAFKEWFDELIEDEMMTVRLDHDFGPLIEQNGYETQVENLSGGEKTAVALAYRLALNKILNESLEQLKTQGLLILDEPTDGFSSEQLDRVQEVLSNLGLEQILVVSHEAKMESFVDHIIRVVKNEHESHVLVQKL